jgi:hypothetical protein
MLDIQLLKSELRSLLKESGASRDEIKQRLASFSGQQPFRPAFVNGERVKRQSDNVRITTNGNSGNLTDAGGH